MDSMTDVEKVGTLRNLEKMEFNTLKELKDYLNSVEILNRQSLPLQPNFNQKVQNYFKDND